MARLVSWFPSGFGRLGGGQSDPGIDDSAAHLDPRDVLEDDHPSARPLAATRHPAGAGAWHELDSHTLIFRPQGYGYGLGATVKIALPGSVHLVGGHDPAATEVGTWTVPPGSTVRLQQLLATSTTSR